MKRYIILSILLAVSSEAQAITQTVAAGDEVNGGDVNSIVTQLVYGTTRNMTVSGVQDIMSGGKSYNSTVYNQQIVETGGTSYNTYVWSSATQRVSGEAYSSTVSSRGSISVKSGGYAQDTTMNGGVLTVSKGATASGTIQKNGVYNVSGKDENATISGGTQEILSGGNSSGANISGGTQQVDAGAQSSNAIISDSGRQKVYGTILNNTINSGARTTVYSGGLAENTQINGGTLEINSGGRSSNSIINSGRENVYGTATGSIINGGYQTVYSSGKSIGATINDGGQQRVYGNIQNSTVNLGGEIYIYDGTTANQTTLNGGLLEVASGATANKTIINSGKSVVSGTDENATINGGTQEILNGGISNYANLTGGTQQIDVGGTSNQAIISGSGYQLVQGTANQTTLNGGLMEVASGATANKTIINSGKAVVSGTDENATINGGTQEILNGGISNYANLTGGTQQIDVGGTSNQAIMSGSGYQLVQGTAEQTTINGGLMEVASGATANQTILNSGSQSIFGIATDTVINGGVQRVEKGGISSLTTVANGGVQSIYSGGIAENTTVNKGGFLFLFDGGSLQGTTKITEGVLTVMGNQQLSDLELQNSAVNIPYSGSFSTLKIDNLNGSGLFSINSSLSQGEADSVQVASGSGNFGLLINDYSPSGDTPNRFKVITETGATDDFYLIGGAVDVGAFEYNLVKNGNDWYLARTDNVTDSSVIAKDTYSSLSSLFYTHLSPVYNHIRSRRNHAATDNGLWIKGLGQKLKFDYEDNSRSEIEIYGSEIGYDREIWRGGGKYLSLGVYGGFTSSRQRYDRMGRGEADTKVVGLYSVLNTDDDWFADFVSSYFWHTQKITSHTPAGEPVNGKYNTNSWQVSANVGKRLKFEESWFIEPSAGINYMRIKGISYRTNFNTLVESDDENYLSMRADLVAGKTFTFDSGNYLDIYGRFAIIHDMDGKNTITVADYAFTEDMSSMRYQIGAGINAGWNEQGSGYLDISTQPGSRVQIPWEINLGLQYRF